MKLCQPVLGVRSVFKHSVEVHYCTIICTVIEWVYHLFIPTRVRKIVEVETQDAQKYLVSFF